MHMYGSVNAHEPGCFGLVSCMCRHSNMTALCCCGNRHALQQVPATRRKGNAEAQLTLPKWEFSCGEDRGTMKTVRHAHTLKSHHITSLDAADGTLRPGTVQRRSLPQPHYVVRLAHLKRLYSRCGMHSFKCLSLEAALACNATQRIAIYSWA